jgi:hypothetical protein
VTAGTLLKYNEWVEQTQVPAIASGHGSAYHVPELFGFMMGFRKDMPIQSYTQNILLRGGLQFGQGVFRGSALFSCVVQPCYVRLALSSR